jgi:hypothetical protein
MLNSVAEVIDAVGGPIAACNLVGIKSGSAPSNWKARGKIPSEHFLVFTAALRERGKEADPAIFGLTVPASA